MISAILWLNGFRHCDSRSSDALCLLGEPSVSFFRPIRSALAPAVKHCRKICNPPLMRAGILRGNQNGVTHKYNTRRIIQYSS